MYKEHSVVWDNTKVARFWDVISKNKELTNTYFTKMAGKEVIEDIEMEIGLKGKEILDYGSGPGHLFASILKLNLKLKYYALEFSKESIDELNARFRAAPSFGEGFYVNDFPAPINQKFDLIICCEVVEHLDDEMLNSFLIEAKRLLKPQGYIYITTPNDENLEVSKVNCPDCGCTFHRWQHLRSWNEKSLSRFMETNGFRTHRTKALNYMDKSNAFLRLKKLIRDNVLFRDTPKRNLCYIGQLQ